MIKDLPDVPPAVLLLVHEVASAFEAGLGRDYVGIRRRLKSMLREFRDQSEAHLSSSLSREIPPINTLELDIHLHSGLNLFSPYSRSCADLGCRLASAEQLSRSIGLIADRAWLTDSFTDRFIDFGRATNAKLDELMQDAMVLLRIWPLIDAGILRFQSPWVAACSSCMEHFDRQIEDIAAQLAKKFIKQFRVTRKPDGHYFIETGDCFEPPKWLHGYTNTKPPTAKSFAENLIYEEVRTALWVGREAAMRGGAIFSNSRLGISGLLQQEGRFAGKAPLSILDHERSVNVPWISELQPHQIVQLRQEAINALPAFRERMAKAMSIDDDLGVSGSKSRDVIQTLREQAVEVRSELEVAKKHSRNYLKGAGSLVGLGLCVYGAVADQPQTTMVGLSTLIGLLINHSNHQKEIEKPTFKPGYVLVKAQDILAHAH